MNTNINEEALDKRASSQKEEKSYGKGIDTLFKFSEIINSIIGKILAIILTVMTVLVFWQVLSRFVTGTSLRFSEELARFLMIWLIMLGSAYAQRNDGLISVDILTDIVKGKVRRGLKVVINVISIVFYVILLVYGWYMSQRASIQIAPGTGISMFWPMFSLSVGAFLLIFNSLINIVKEIVGKELKS